MQHDHMIRTEQYCAEGQHTKSFFNTDIVYGLHQHFSYGCIAKGRINLWTIFGRRLRRHNSHCVSVCAAQVLYLFFIFLSQANLSAPFQLSHTLSLSALSKLSFRSLSLSLKYPLLLLKQEYPIYPYFRLKVLNP